ncbi:hypothetical protein [Kitasatospora sp. NPDC097643]
MFKTAVAAAALVLGAALLFAVAPSNAAPAHAPQAVSANNGNPCC